MAMAVCVSDVPLPPPICRRPASFHATSPLSPASGKSPRRAPAISEDEFNEKFFAEYGCDPTQLFFTKEEVQMLMRQYEAEKAYLLSNGEGKETTQVAPPPPTGEEADNAEVQTPPPPLPKSSKKKRKAEAATPPSPRPSHSDVAERILNRQFETPEPSKGVTILSCQCRELERDCVLHQEAPFRSWMSEQGNVLPAGDGGGGGWARVPKLSENCGRCLFQ